tara:strand:+ start:46 stop:489 length:444 start_codon:yes stop_codon:yes gene_type:complete
MKKFIIAIILLTSTVLAEDQVTVLEKPPLEKSLKVFLEGITYTYNEKDLEDHLTLYHESIRDFMRRKQAFEFLYHPDARMEIENHFVLSENEQSVEILVGYDIGRHVVISQMLLMKEGNELHLIKENVQSKEDKFCDSYVLHRQALR